MNDPTTLEDYILKYKSQAMLMSSYFLEEWLEAEDEEDYFKVFEENILSKHTNYLDESKSTVEFTDEEYRKYRCNAHRLSYDVYGTTELWFLILHANEMFSEAEFNVKKCKLYSISVLTSIKEILAVENELIEKNRSSVLKKQAILKKKFDTSQS